MTSLTIVFSILVYSKWSIDLTKLIIGSITGYTGSAAAMCINDYIDAKVDSINKPWKPIPSGLVNRNKVLHMSILLLLITISINIFIDYKLVLIASIYGVLGYIYSFLRKYWWSQFIVCLSTTAPLIYGYVASNNPPEYLYFTILFATSMFTAILGREVVKAIIDIEGDRKYGYYTVPIKYGLNYTKKILYVNSITPLLIGIIAGLTIEKLPIIYLTLISIAGVIYSYYLLKTTKSISNKDLLEKTRRNTLIAMFIGIIAFFTINL